MIENLAKKLTDKLKKEGRSKKWFISKYFPNKVYNTINMQLLGYNKLKNETLNAIKNYLEQ